MRDRTPSGLCHGEWEKSICTLVVKHTETERLVWRGVFSGSLADHARRLLNREARRAAKLPKQKETQ